MAMLAEPKRRVKWSEDPRNVTWSRDTNKYGYRMLQKMGWMDGKGLGMNEEGSVDFVRVKKNRENNGVGSKTMGDEWIGHQDAFDDLLAQLNAHQQQQDREGSVPESLPSCEAKGLVKTAQDSKKLVYKKFLQSKDLSCKTEEDMNCIFGRKKTRKRQKQDMEASPLDMGGTAIDISGDSVEQPLVSHGIPTITRKLSVHDYFTAKRMEITNKKKEPVLDETIPPSSDAVRACADDELKDVKSSAKRKRRRADT